MFFPELAENFMKLVRAVKDKKIAVVGHMRPDGDCMSSQFAMAAVFEKFGAAEVVCLNKDPLPYLYENFSKGKKLLPTEGFEDASFEIVTVDCADYKRIGEDFAARHPNPLGCIDHHSSNHPYARINIFDPSSAATAEIIAGLLFDAGAKIDPESANRLYMGMAMDTRQFTTNSTGAKTLAIAAKLVESGAEPAYVAEQLYQRERFGKMKLLAYFLQSLTMHAEGKICMGIIPLGTFEKTGSSKEDTDGLVDYARSIEGVEIAILLEELPKGLKGSFRAKTPKFEVDTLAGEFGGGGHKAAAGFSVDGASLNDFVPKLLKLVEKRINSVK